MEKLQAFVTRSPWGPDNELIFEVKLLGSNLILEKKKRSRQYLGHHLTFCCRLWLLGLIPKLEHQKEESPVCHNDVMYDYDY